MWAIEPSRALPIGGVSALCAVVLIVKQQFNMLAARSHSDSCEHFGAQELRRENARKIAEARAKAPELIDASGYDVVVVPEGATVKQDGSKMRVFTKSDYRKLLSTVSGSPL